MEKENLETRPWIDTRVFECHHYMSLHINVVDTCLVIVIVTGEILLQSFTFRKKQQKLGDSVTIGHRLMIVLASVCTTISINFSKYICIFIHFIFNIWNKIHIHHIKIIIRQNVPYHTALKHKPAHWKF